MGNFNEFLSLLRNGFSKDSSVLTPGEDGFDELLRRWSDLDVKVPGAIVEPTTEEDFVLAASLTLPRALPMLHSSL